MANIAETDQLENCEYTQKLCPFLKELRKDCYCTNMNSNNVPFALRFCVGEFDNCRIFQAIKGDLASPGAKKALE